MSTAGLTERHQQLQVAEQEANQRLADLQGQIAELERQRHQALTDTDFDLAEQHHVAAERLRERLPAASARAAAMGEAQRHLAAQVLTAGHTTRRDDLLAAMATARLATGEHLAEANDLLAAAATALGRAQAQEALHDELWRELQPIRVALGEEPERHVRQRPAADSIAASRLLTAVVEARQNGQLT